MGGKSIPAKLPLLRQRQITDTIATKRRYIRMLAKSTGPRSAAEKVGISYRTTVKWRATDPEFARQEVEARAKYLELLEIEADRRGVDGIDKPVYFQGEKVDTNKVYSDHLLMFRLKKLDPKYRDSSGGSSTSGPTTVNIYLPDNSRADEKVMIDVTPSTPKLPDKS